ncbi:MAG: DUF4267 domain-containing protein [Solirubrobacterales bacterium]
MFRSRSIDAKDRQLAIALGAGRIAIGAFAFAAPKTLLGQWGFPAAESGPTAEVLARLVGIRDIALGAATLAVLDDRESLAGIAALGAGVDVGDTVGSAMSAGQGLGKVAGGTAAVALPAAVAGAWLANRLR